jgi:predicted RNA-binding protein with PIN domain
MHYYIDGYNLLFRILDPGNNLKIQRQRLIKELAARVNLLELDATIVFDSHYQLEEEVGSHLKCLGIIFTAAGETADEFILKKIKESPKPSKHTVVTSDKKLAWLCQKRLAKTESVEAFTTMLDRRYKNRLQSVTADKEKKDKAETQTPPAKEEASVKKMSKPAPQKKASPEECFDYYLEVFQKKSEAAPTAEKAPKEIASSSGASRRLRQGDHPSKKTAAQDPAEKEGPVSEMQRWLKAFERKTP